MSLKTPTACDLVSVSVSCPGRAIRSRTACFQPTLLPKLEGQHSWGFDSPAAEFVLSLARKPSGELSARLLRGADA
jgi:hypothetical protein